MDSDFPIGYDPDGIPTVADVDARFAEWQREKAIEAKKVVSLDHYRKEVIPPVTSFLQFMERRRDARIKLEDMVRTGVIRNDVVDLLKILDEDWEED